MNIEKEVFDVELDEENIFAKIAFEKILANENEKIILVEGEYDKELLSDLFNRYNKKNIYFIQTYGKNNALEYFKFDDNIYCILDRDFEENKKNKKIFYTYYANIEADILNFENINEIVNEKTLKKNSDHIKTLETFKKKLYMGKMVWKKMRNQGKYKNKWFKLKNEEDFLKEELFEKCEKKDNYFDYKNKTGIHCAKEIFKILLYNDREKINDYSYFLKLKASSISENNPLIKRIILNEVFNN